MMKGTEKIIEHIRADAQAAVDGIIAEAEAKAAAIKADYEKKAAEVYSEKLRAGEKLCEDKVEGANRIAGMEARKGILALKQEMVTASFDKAAQLLTELPEEQYVKLLAGLAANASVTGDEKIVLNSRDAKIADKVIAAANAELGKAGKNAALSLSDKAGSFAGGLVLQRSNIEVNCTVELLVELSKGGMSAELAGVLFE